MFKTVKDRTGVKNRQASRDFDGTTSDLDLAKWKDQLLALTETQTQLVDRAEDEAEQIHAREAAEAVKAAAASRSVPARTSTQSPRSEEPFFDPKGPYMGPERRATGERRSGVDRREGVAAIEKNKRYGKDRRQGGRRATDRARPVNHTRRASDEIANGHASGEVTTIRDIRLRALRGRDRRGSILAITLVLVSIAALGSLLMTRTINDHQRLNRRSRQLNQAFYAAEAGVAQFLHWCNFPADYSSDPALFLRTSPMLDDEGNPVPFEQQFSALAAAAAANLKITESDLVALGVSRMVSGHGDFISKVREIQFLSAPPDGVTAPAQYDLIVRSVGQSADGIERRIVAFAKVNTLDGNPDVDLKAGLLSFGNVNGIFGAARVHWGESWTKGDFQVPPKSRVYYLDASSGSGYDSYAAYRTESDLIFDASWPEDPVAPYDPGSIFDHHADRPGLFPDATGDYANAFFQSEPSDEMDWPDLAAQYDTFRNLALQNGRYYTTDSANKIYKNGVEVDFMIEFGVADPDASPYDLVFIDTIDALPPAADGSNLATITISGSGMGLKGVYYICADIMVLSINAPAATVTDPEDNSQNLSDVLLDGVLYSAGDSHIGDGVRIYGSVIAERGFRGFHECDIWYNAQLAEGLPMQQGNLGSVFRVVRKINLGHSASGS